MIPTVPSARPLRSGVATHEERSRSRGADPRPGAAGGTPGPKVRTRAAPAELRGRYAAGLREHCTQGGEAGLLAAYRLGRQAAAEGLGMLELAGWHEELVAVLLDGVALDDRARIMKRASGFFAECLAAFELTRRGFQQLNSTLQELNRSLQHRLHAALHDCANARGRLVKQLRLADRKDEVVSIISHEVRTPLTSIHGALTLLGAGIGGKLSHRGQKLLSVACRNSQRLVRFVSDGLDLQRIESGTTSFDLRVIEVGPFLRQAIEASRGYASQRGVTLARGRVTRGVLVRTDPDRLMQVMSNLLSNAAKFSPRERTVVVAARRRRGLVRISVRDEGPGVPESFRRHVFERFAQAGPSPTSGGSGLGLSISKAIVERMGGRIAFQSATGRGTTFFFELPEWHPPSPK